MTESDLPDDPYHTMYDSLMEPVIDGMAKKDRLYAICEDFGCEMENIVVNSEGYPTIKYRIRGPEHQLPQWSMLFSFEDILTLDLCDIVSWMVYYISRGTPESHDFMHAKQFPNEEVVYGYHDWCHDKEQEPP